MGAVNTVVNDEGILTGYNTDVIGIGRVLEIAGINPTDGCVLVIGSGDAARACMHFMVGRNCDVTVTARNAEKGETLARDFGQIYRSPASASVKMYNLVVNCTPVGIYSEEPYPVNIEGLDGQVMFDMVYSREMPLETIAREREYHIAHGADILAGQGEAAFEF